MFTDNTCQFFSLRNLKWITILKQTCPLFPPFVSVMGKLKSSLKSTPSRPKRVRRRKKPNPDSDDYLPCGYDCPGCKKSLEAKKWTEKKLSKVKVNPCGVLRLHWMRDITLFISLNKKTSQHFVLILHDLIVLSGQGG